MSVPANQMFQYQAPSALDSGAARYQRLAGLQGATTLGQGAEGVPIVRLPYEMFSQDINYNDFGGAQQWAEQRGWQLTPENADSILASFRHDMEGNKDRRDNIKKAVAVGGLALGGLGLAGIGPLGGSLGGVFGGAAGAGGAAGTAAAAGATPGILGGAGAAGASAAIPWLSGFGGAGGGTPQAGGDQKWWQSILGNLGGGQGDLMGNIFAGIQGAGALSALGGGNPLSDMLGLTNRTNGFTMPNRTGPGGASTSYDAGSNTITGSAGNLDPVQAAFAGAAGQNITQAGQSSQADILNLLRQQAKPQEDEAFNRLNNNLFSRGRLGAEDTATSEAYRGFSRGLSEADTARQIGAYGVSDQLQNSAINRGVASAEASRGIQTGATTPTSSMFAGQNPAMLDFLAQIFQRQGG